MRVLYIATSFPEPEKGATIYTDLAESIYEAGHEITVVVSEQKKSNREIEMKKELGFDVLRIPTGNYYDVGYIEKGITTLKFPFFMRRGIKRYLKNRVFDLILFEAPPVTNSSLIAWAKKQFQCTSYLMLKDIFPQNAVDLGIIKQNGLLFRYFKVKEKMLYQIADHIGCMSPANTHYLLEHNPWILKDKVEIFPNTKKFTMNIEPKGYPMREHFEISKETCVFLFGGNMGRPQYIDLLCKVIIACKEEESIYFLFVGRGTDRYKLEEAIWNYKIKNARVIGNLPRVDYEQLIKECDVGLICLNPNFTIPNYPSRILSYMEYGKPVLAATDNVSDIKELIEEAKCGEWVWSGSMDGFVNMVRKMAESSNLSHIGMNGRLYIENNFTVAHSIAILEKHFYKEDKSY